VTDQEEPADGEAAYGLVMPFVVCQPDGPYDPASFVAGIYAGELLTLLPMMAKVMGSLVRYYPTALVPQLDLIAMENGYRIVAEPWDEHPEEWTRVELVHPASAEPQEGP
jgi:hypothetical protein